MNIPLELMPQQVLAGPENDWTGTTDPKERKKLQDRIHQRNTRRRRKARLVSDRPNTHLMVSRLSSRQSCSYDIETFTACDPSSERTEQFIRYFSTWLHQEYQIHPHTDLLLSLVQFNVTRALVVNAETLGLTSQFMSPGSRSPFASPTTNTNTSPTFLPSSLQPTILQLTTPHHPWIDLLPVPELRDNLLRRDETSYDAAQLCRDLRGFQHVADGRGGVAVWGEPWDPSGWEVTEAFVCKWPWVVQGYQSLFASTNYWRAARGEAPLSLEIG